MKGYSIVLCRLGIASRYIAARNKEDRKERGHENRASFRPTTHRHTKHAVNRSNENNSILCFSSALSYLKDVFVSLGWEFPYFTEVCHVSQLPAQMLRRVLWKNTRTKFLIISVSRVAVCRTGFDKGFRETTRLVPGKQHTSPAGFDLQ